jgi:hypothetical protein
LNYNFCGALSGALAATLLVRLIAMIGLQIERLLSKKEKLSGTFQRITGN